MSKLREPLVTEIAKGVWHINELGLNSMYVIEGTEKSLVVDAGSGYCHFREIVESLTDKPYDVAITHAHPDHIGMCRQFERVFVNRKELGRIRKPGEDEGFKMPGMGGPFVDSLPTEPSKRLSELERDGQMSGMFKRCTQKEYDIKDFFLVYNQHVKYYDTWEISEDMICKGDYDTELVFIDEGYEFDLGDRKIKTMYLPGHSAGHLLFIDPKTRIAFTGDCVNGNNGSGIHAASTHIRYIEPFLEEYGKSYDRIYNGHCSYGGTFSSRSEDIQVVRNLAEAYRALLRGEAHVEERASHLFPDGPKHKVVIYGDGTKENPRVTPGYPPRLWEEGEEHIIP